MAALSAWAPIGAALMDTVQPIATLSSADLASVREDPPEAHIQRYLRFRGTKQGETVALEAIDPTTQKYRYWPFMLALTSDPRGVEVLAIKSDNELQPKGCFIHQNEIKAAVAAKQPQGEWLPVKRDQGLKATSIASRRAFYLDFDPVREDGISSTTSERRLAFERADRAAILLTELLGDDHALGYGSSGNGAHVHVALDSLPNDEETETLVHACLDATDRILSDDFVKVDTRVHDARRIGPLFGTVKRKGAHFIPAEVPRDQWRPHRATGFVCRDEVRRLSLDELRSLRVALDQRAAATASAALLLPPTAPQPATPATTLPLSTSSPWDLAKAVDIEDVSDWLGCGRQPQMVCPGCGSKAGYGRVPNSNVTKCHHQRCASRGVPRSGGARTTIDLVCEVRKVAAKQALGLLGKQFGFVVSRSPAQPSRPAPPTPPAATNARWEADLLRDSYGQVRSLGANAELILAHDAAWVGVLRFNEIANSVVFGAAPPSGFLPRQVGDEWTEQDDVAAVHWLARNWLVNVGETTIGGIVALAAKRAPFDPLCDSLRSLVWDGTPRVDSWLTQYLGAQDSPYVRLVGRWWLISAVARAFKPGCQVHHALILEGAQGAGKSTVVQLLAGEDFYLEDVGDVGSIEAAKQLQGMWVVELAELDALRRAEQTTIKRFVSQRTDRYRPSYGRRAQTFARRCVFIGTTNRADYLRDATGGRRFWPVKCGCIALDEVAADRDQLLAEAVALFDAGHAWWPQTDEERALCGSEQAERYDEDIWTQKVAAFVRDRAAVQTHEVLTELGVEVARMGGENAKRVGAVMLQLGWQQERRREGGARARRWVRGADAQAVFDVKQRFRAHSDNVVPLRTGPDHEAAPPGDDRADAIANANLESLGIRDWSLE